MAYVKVSLSSAYFSRYQVKYKRRRQGKTDYRARLRLCGQDKNKYNTPKYRLCVRFTNSDIVAQVIYATIAGDICICAAYAHELPRYGLSVGLTNWSAGYAVGLLLARRLLTKYNLAELYTGVKEATGEDYEVEEAEEGPRPFTALLDTGLKRTSTGSKVFAVLKGALDGGLSVPHSEKRFVGYNKEDKKLDSEMLRKYILGGHISEYMESMQEDEPEKYEKHFARFIKAGMEPGTMGDMYKKVHAAIRADPSPKQKERKAPGEKKKWKQVPLTYDERKDKLKERLAKTAEGDMEE